MLFFPHLSWGVFWDLLGKSYWKKEGALLFVLKCLSHLPKDSQQWGCWILGISLSEEHELESPTCLCPNCSKPIRQKIKWVFYQTSAFFWISKKCIGLSVASKHLEILFLCSSHSNAKHVQQTDWDKLVFVHLGLILYSILSFLLTWAMYEYQKKIRVKGIALRSEHTFWNHLSNLLSFRSVSRYASAFMTLKQLYQHMLDRKGSHGIQSGTNPCRWPVEDARWMHQWKWKGHTAGLWLSGRFLNHDTGAKEGMAPRGMEAASWIWLMLTEMSNWWLTSFRCFSSYYGKSDRSRFSLSPKGLGASKVLSHLVSLLWSSPHMERDHQERDRVRGFHGVKADSTAFHPISGSKGDSVSKTLVLRHKKMRFGTLKK